MADFERAFAKVVANEGGYVNNPNDKGGETYMGICRKNYSKNYMWTIIDVIKNRVGNVVKYINEECKKNKELLIQVKSIYKINYWNKLNLNEIKSQTIANMMFDDAVNRGLVAAIKTAQKVVKMKETGRMSKELMDKLKTYG